MSAKFSDFSMFLKSSFLIHVCRTSKRYWLTVSEQMEQHFEMEVNTLCVRYFGFISLWDVAAFVSEDLYLLTYHLGGYTSKLMELLQNEKCMS